MKQIILADNNKNIAQNRKARHDYQIEQIIEAGVVLVGTEVKSCRAGKVSLVDSYAAIQEGEVWLYNANINVYAQGNINNHEPTRKRKLLLNKSEIRKLVSKIKNKGLTLVTLRMYFSNGKVKVELGLAKGKKSYDKRQDIAKRDFERSELRKIKL